MTETFQRSNLHTITAGQRARSGPPDDAAALTRKRQAQIALEFNSLEFNKEVVDFGKSALQTIQNARRRTRHTNCTLDRASVGTDCPLWTSEQADVASPERLGV